MSASVRSIQTDSGEIKVRDPGPEIPRELGTLFPQAGWIEDEGRRLLAFPRLSADMTVNAPCSHS